jgi:hypothetical protein
MKSISLLLFAFILSATAFAQRTIQLRNLWIRPQVHVLFQGYSISFTIKDIDKALQLLSETGDTTYGTSCGLDTAGDYVVELFSGLKMEYHKPLQIILQKAVGAFLISSGHAYIVNPRHKIVRAVVSDIKPLSPGVDDAYVIFTDPNNDNTIFTGIMPADIYNKDLGID